MDSDSGKHKLFSDMFPEVLGLNLLFNVLIESVHLYYTMLYCGVLGCVEERSRGGLALKCSP